MKIKSIVLFGLLVTIAVACKKSKIKKQITGKWIVTAMYTDDADLLLQKKKGKFYATQCDTVLYERQETLYSEVVFKKKKKYTRTEKITIQYLDTAASRIQCKAVYADSTLNITEEGKWRFEGKETLELLGNNNNYEGNKLIAISDNEMEWQTDLIVDQGIVLFTGIKTTKLTKQ
jgi:hypothetical protein